MYGFFVTKREMADDFVLPDFISDWNIKKIATPNGNIIILYKGMSLVNGYTNGQYFLFNSSMLNSEMFYSDIEEIKQKSFENGFYLDNDDPYISFISINAKSGLICGSRDPIGNSHIYYNDDEFKPSLFSNVLLYDAIFKKKHDINKKVLPNYFFYHYISAPYTIFDNVLKLKQGESVFSIEESASNNVWGHTSRNTIAESINEKSKIIENDFENKILETIKKLIGEKRYYSSFLSGGIDSTLVSCFANEISKESNNDNFYSLTVGFDNEKYDESRFASKIAEYGDIKNSIKKMNYEQFRNVVEELPLIYGEPYADSSEVCTVEAFSNVPKNNELVLIGDGGDEFFYGYKLFKRANSIQKNLPFLRIAKPFFRFVPKLKKHQHIVLGKDVYMHLYNNNNIEMINNMFFDKSLRVSFQLCEKEKQLSQARDKIAANYMSFSLPEDSATKISFASLYYEKNAFSPFLTKNIACSALAINPNVKIDKEYGTKSFLKQILFKRIPREFFERPKHGFAIPLCDWLFEKDFIDYISPLFEKEFVKKQGLFEYQAIKSIFDSYYSNKIKDDRFFFSIVMFQIWYKNVCAMEE